MKWVVGRSFSTRNFLSKAKAHWGVNRIFSLPFSSLHLTCVYLVPSQSSAENGKTLLDDVWKHNLTWQIGERRRRTTKAFCRYWKLEELRYRNFLVVHIPSRSHVNSDEAMTIERVASTQAFTDQRLNDIIFVRKRPARLKCCFRIDSPPRSLSREARKLSRVYEEKDFSRDVEANAFEQAMKSTHSAGCNSLKSFLIPQ